MKNATNDIRMVRLNREIKSNSGFDDGSFEIRERIRKHVTMVPQKKISPGIPVSEATKPKISWHVNHMPVIPRSTNKSNDCGENCAKPTPKTGCLIVRIKAFSISPRLACEESRADPSP
jgi:hypothetical protein